MAEHKIENGQAGQRRWLGRLQREITHLLEQSWQQKLLSRLIRGPVHVDELDGPLVHEDLVERNLLKNPEIGRDQRTRLITDLEGKGFLRRDCDTLTGLGEYSQVHLTETEHQVLSEMGWFSRITARGVKKKLANKISTREIEDVLEGLVARGYVDSEQRSAGGSILYRRVEKMYEIRRNHSSQGVADE